MALQRNPYASLPKDVVMLPEQEAIMYQNYIIKNWPKPSDVFPLRYGSMILGGGTLFSAIYINNHFRRKFKLLSYGRGASYLPICAMPAAVAFLSHAQFVSRKMILLSNESCPVCLEVRAAVLQASLGVLFPLIIAPIGCMALVQRYFTFNIPSITREPKKVLNLLQKQIKPIKSTLWGMVAAQAFLGMAVTYFEGRSMFKIFEELAKEPSELNSH